jgi:hypothetical protein
MARTQETDFGHFGIIRTKPYDMDAAIMQLQHHGWGSHVVREGGGHVTAVTAAGIEHSTTRGRPRQAPLVQDQLN